MAEGNLCNICKQEMNILREQIVAGTKYKILKCEKCEHEVARAEG